MKRCVSMIFRGLFSFLAVFGVDREAAHAPGACCYGVYWILMLLFTILI